MTYIPTRDGYMRVKDSEKLLHAIFPNWPDLEPCRTAPALEPVQEQSTK